MSHDLIRCRSVRRSDLRRDRARGEHGAMFGGVRARLRAYRCGCNPAIEGSIEHRREDDAQDRNGNKSGRTRDGIVHTRCDPRVTGRSRI